MQTDSQIRNKLPFTTARKRIKHLGMQLTRKAKDLYKGTTNHCSKKSEINKPMEKHPMLMNRKNKYC